MATRTLTMARFDGDRVRYEVDYDDVSMLVTALRCANGSAKASSGRVWLVDDPTRDFPQGSFEDRTLARITPAGVTESQAVPTNQSRRLGLIVADRRGTPVVANLGGEFMWPAA
jgi:hypothetical protein